MRGGDVGLLIPAALPISPPVKHRTPQNLAQYCFLAIHTQWNALPGRHIRCNNRQPSNHHAALVATTVRPIFIQPHIVKACELVQYCIHMHSTLCDSRTQVPCISPCTIATRTCSSPLPDGYLDLYSTSSPANWHTHVALYFLQDGR